MKPRGRLMIEHRVTERMLDVVNREVGKMLSDRVIEPIFIKTVVDFFQTYADRTHHGKEEEILFKELENKNMTDKHTSLMMELIKDHKSARQVVLELKEANKEYSEGHDEFSGKIISKLQFLLDIYPRHIMKEDTIFFPQTESYFTKAELDEMLNKFTEFDSRMIHEKYSNLINEMKEKYSSKGALNGRS